MNNFGEYITPSEYLKRYPIMKNDHSLKDLKRMSKLKGTCSNCSNEPIWKLGQTGMCFTCTTGEADASDDFELIEE